MSVFVSVFVGSLAYSLRNLFVVAIAEKLIARGHTPLARAVLKAALKVPDLPWAGGEFRACLVAMYANVAEPREEGLDLVCKQLERSKGLGEQFLAMLLLAKIQALSALLRYEEAYQALRATEEELRKNPEVWAVAQIHLLLDGFQSGRSAEVESLIPQVLADSPENLKSPALTCAALVNRSMHRFEDAYAQLREAEGLESTAERLMLLADTELILGRIQDARVHFRQAMERGASNGSDGSYYLAIGENQKAQQALEEFAAALDPNPANNFMFAIKLTEGVIALQSLDYPAACRAFEQTLNYISSEHERAQAYSQWAIAEAALGKQDEAQTMLANVQSIGALFPGNTRLVYLLAQAQFMCAHHDSQHHLLESLASRALEFAPPCDQCSIFYFHGLSQKKVGDPMARESFQRAHESGPEFHYGKLAAAELSQMT